MTRSEHEVSDPRARWGVLPEVVVPSGDDVQTKTVQVGFDVPPAFDPIQGMVRTYN